MRSRLELAMSRPVVLRSLRYAVVVGALLIAINHGDAILSGDVPPSRLLRMILTVLVPYTVSTLSSIEALRPETARTGGPEAQPAEPPRRPDVEDSPR